jgi:hypothetical protein
MKDKTAAKTETKTPAPTINNLWNHPMTAVMRALGKADLCTAHVRAILTKLGIKAGDSTLSIQVNAGRAKDYAGRGEPAALTAAQIKQLCNVAPDPTLMADPAPEKK